MEKEELNVLLDQVDVKIKEAVKTEVTSAIDGTLTKADFEARMKEFGVEAETLKKINESIEKQGQWIHDQKAGQSKETKLQTVKEWLEANKATLEEVQKTKAKKVISVPVVRKAVTVGSSVTNITGYLIPGFEDMPVAPTDIDQAFTRLSIPAGNEGSIYYTDQTTNTRNAAMATEGVSGTDSAHAWTRSSVKVVKALATEKVSYEALTDIPEMQATLQRLLGSELMHVKAEDLWDGAGTTIYCKGIYTAAPSFDYASYSGKKIVAPTIFDLARLMKTQIRKNYGKKFMPNKILLNDEDYFAAVTVKDELGQFVRDPFLSPDGMTLGGMQIVVSPYVDQGQMVVGDFRYAYLYEADNIEIELGYDTGDFDDDLTTIKARHRFATLIRSVDAYGFYKVDSIDAALAAITEATA